MFREYIQKLQKSWNIYKSNTFNKISEYIVQFLYKVVKISAPRIIIKFISINYFLQFLKKYNLKIHIGNVN